MTEIKVRSVPDDLVDRLDKLAEEEHYASRSQLIVDILTLYVTSKSQFFQQAISPVVNNLCIEAIKEQYSQAEKTADLLLPICLKMLAGIDDIKALFDIK